jgi:phospholipid/cholesterol/gamma-HCH transport system substrate-binding protein
MKNKTNYFKIGVFVIIAIVLAVASVVVLGAGSLFQETVTIETYFDGSVQGLNVGSPLKFRGVPIGKVDLITVTSWIYNTEQLYILVRCSLPAKQRWFTSSTDTKQMLKVEAARGLRVRLATQGLTGSAFLEVDFLDQRANPRLKIDWEPEYPYLPSAPSIMTRLSDSLTSIMNSLEKLNLDNIAVNLEKTMEAAISVLQGADIGGIMTEAHNLLSEIRETNHHLDRLIKGGATKSIVEDASATLAGTRRLVENTEKPLLAFLSSIKTTSQSLDRLVKKLDATSAHLPETVTQAQNTLLRLDQLLTIPQQSLEETMDNLRLASENLKTLTEESKKYPSYLLFGRPPDRIEPGDRR